MTEFVREDLTGARFEDVYLTGASFRDVDLSNARFELVDLTGVRIRDAVLTHLVISGELDDVVINGVDVVPLLEAELDRRYPQRPKMRPKDAAGFREAWGILEGLWAQTVDRARALPSAALDTRVEGEWSFIETLRHLLFATDAWVNRAVLGVVVPWDALDLPHDEMPDTPTVPRDRGARPSLDTVLALRSERQARVKTFLATLTDEQLAGDTEPVAEPGYPESESFPIRRCLQAVVSEEWQHRLYMERDLAVLEEAASRLT